MRKILAILLMLVCVSSLTACKEGTLDNVNTDSNNTTNQEEQKKIPIQSFDGKWKEADLPEEKDITASQWFEINIKNGTISVYWMSYYDQFADSYDRCVRVWGSGVWENPTEDVTEYLYNSKCKLEGYVVDKDGNLIEQYSHLSFTYDNGRLSISLSNIGHPFTEYRNTDIIYFEKISD